MKKAFTLAEVLISVAIIGVITAIVIPSFLQNTNDTECKTAWKKSYSDAINATKQILVDDPIAFGRSYSNTQLKDLFNSKLRVLKTCQDGQSIGNCWPSTYSHLDGSATDTLADGAGLVLVSGATVMFSSSKMYIDTNGLKLPNRWGKDIFGITITGTGIIPDAGDCSTAGTGCAYEYLYNMHYSGCQKPNFLCLDPDAGFIDRVIWGDFGCPANYSCVPTVKAQNASHNECQTPDHSQRTNVLDGYCPGGYESTLIVFM